MKLATLVAVAAAVGAPSWAAPEDQPLGQFLLWGDGNSFTTFGPNQFVTIDLASIGFACDFIFPAANIYVVPSGSVVGGAALSDVSGGVNQVIGAGGGVIVGETIASTLPGGTLGAGTYAVVFDECENGIFDPGQDACFDPAFVVDLPAVLPPADPAIAAAKAGWGAQAVTWAEKTAAWAEYFAVLQAADALSAILQPGIGTVYWFLTNTVPPFSDIGPPLALKYAIDMVQHYQGLAADPPDPNFQQLTPLEANAFLDSQSPDPLQQATDALINAFAVEAATTGALLSSMERYQGAANDGNGDWALVHARATRDYTALLADQLAESNAALNALSAVIGANAADLDAAASGLKSLADDLATNGWSPSAQFHMGLLGYTPQDIADGIAALGDLGFVVQDSGVGTVVPGKPDLATFTAAGMQADIAQIVADNDAAVPQLQQSEALWDGIVSTIEGDAGIAKTLPSADAGGPYAGSEGVAVMLDASGSSDPDGSIALYEWDLDFDGAFDDLSTANATEPFVFAAQYEGVVGLRVTDGDGKQAIAYTDVSIADTNAPPSIDSFTPNLTNVDSKLGALIDFAVVTSDPDGDPVDVRWFVDGVDTGVLGGTYQHAANLVGIQTIRAEASNPNASGGTTSNEWFVAAADCPAGWSEFGSGWSGALGVPELTPQANPVLGTTFDIWVGNSSATDTPACVFFSPDQVAVQTPWGGVQYVGEPYGLVVTLHDLPATGTLIPIGLPENPLWCGRSIFAQSIQVDLAATDGLSFSRGIELLIGF